MKKSRRLLTILLAAVMLPFYASESRISVQANAAALASSYNTDLSRILYATPVEDQTQTSYCWAYMADAVLESYLLKNAGNIQMNFNEADMTNQLIGGVHGFSDLYTGGSYHQAVAYWTRGSLCGPRSESDGGLTDYYVSETAELGSYENGNELSKQIYIQNIKNLVAQYGSAGVSVYFNASDRAQTTWMGAYYYPQEISPGVNHGVAVVGWDDNYPVQAFHNRLTNPQQPQHQGAFLVKNSWGSYDSCSIGGNTGYYWISYDNYFQDAFAVTKVISRSKLYDTIYETDYRGLSEYIPGSSYSQTYRLNAGVQWLTGIGTYVRGGAGYRFYVNGQELTQIGGTMAYSGYRTFELIEPVMIAGSSLELRVEVSGSTDAVPVSCTANSHVADTGNICLKAFTRTTATAPSQSPGSTNNTVYPYYPNYPNVWSQTVTGVTVTPQESTLRQGSSQVFSAKVQGSGSPSSRVHWQLSGSSSADTRLTDTGVLHVGTDEASSDLYIYAISDADNTKSAMARVTVLKREEDTPDYSDSSTNGSGTGTNINGTPIYPKPDSSSGTNTPDSSSTGSNGTSTGNTSTGSNGTSTDNTSTGDSNSGGSQNSGGQTSDVKVGTVDKSVYTCSGDGTALYTSCIAKNRISISIPAAVKISGRSYVVTALKDSCLEKNKKVAAVTVGKNISQIGEDAFFGCKKLKKIKIKSEQIDYIGDDAFYNISAKAVIYVPRSCLSEYRAMIRESGNDKVRVKAYN